MKKLLLLGLITSFAFCEVYHNDRETQKKESDYISVRGEVFNISEYSEYTEITIATKENGRIKAKVSSTRLKIGDKVSGSCMNYEYGIYTKCAIF